MPEEKKLIMADPVANGIALYLAQNAYLNDTAQDALEMVARWIQEAPKVTAMVLPCEIGDPVFIIVNLKNGRPSHIIEQRCIGIHISERVFKHRAEKEHKYLVVRSEIGFAQHIPFSEFGKTVFFSRRDAESVMREREGDAP